MKRILCVVSILCAMLAASHGVADTMVRTCPKGTRPVQATYCSQVENPDGSITMICETVILCLDMVIQ